MDDDNDCFIRTYIYYTYPCYHLRGLTSGHYHVAVAEIDMGVIIVFAIKFNKIIAKNPLRTTQARACSVLHNYSLCINNTRPGCGSTCRFTSLMQQRLLSLSLLSIWRICERRATIVLVYNNLRQISYVGTCFNRCPV